MLHFHCTFQMSKVRISWLSNQSTSFLCFCYFTNNPPPTFNHIPDTKVVVAVNWTFGYQIRWRDHLCRISTGSNLTFQNVWQYPGFEQEEAVSFCAGGHVYAHRLPVVTAKQHSFFFLRMIKKWSTRTNICHLIFTTRIQKKTSLFVSVIQKKKYMFVGKHVNYSQDVQIVHKQPPVMMLVFVTPVPNNNSDLLFLNLTSDSPSSLYWLLKRFWWDFH